MNNLNALILSECSNLIGEETANQWLTNQVNNLSPGSTFFLAFGMVPKKVGKQPIVLSETLLIELRKINTEADLVSWSIDELARLALLVHLPSEGRKETLTQLLATSDIREQKLIYKSIQYLTQPEEFELQVIDGIRTNMTDVFDAIALHNSFPLKYFKDTSWNQMVLKGIFMERPIYRISGLDERRNEDLARIAIDFAHERQSAGRKVTPELWRLVVPFVDDSSLQELINVAQSTDDLEREAGLRALSESDFSAAQSWLKTSGTKSDPRSWSAIGEAIFN